MNFQDAEKTHKDLRAQLDAGKLSDSTFEAEVGKLRMQDSQGRWWQIGAQTGEWYMYDGQRWGKAKPPVPTPAPVLAQPLPAHFGTPITTAPARTAPGVSRQSLLGGRNREWVPLAIGALVLLFCAVCLFVTAMIRNSLDSPASTRTPTLPIVTVVITATPASSPLSTLTLGPVRSSSTPPITTKMSTPSIDAPNTIVPESLTGWVASAIVIFILGFLVSIWLFSERRSLMHTKETRPLKVFLCHASQDKETTKKLYDRLRSGRIDPWFDKEKLLAGQDWELEIKKAVRESDVVLVCLSKASTTKEGFVQKEIRMVLDVADEKPEGTIFVIPVILEECNVPERLRKWHWVNYAEREGFDRLMAALHKRAESLKIQL